MLSALNTLYFLTNHHKIFKFFFFQPVAKLNNSFIFQNFTCDTSLAVVRKDMKKRDRYALNISLRSELLTLHVQFLTYTMMLQCFRLLFSLFVSEIFM